MFVNYVNFVRGHASFVRCELQKSNLVDGSFLIYISD